VRLNLFNHADVARIGRQIRENRNEAADLVPAVLDGDAEAGHRMNTLNDAWWQLEETRRVAERLSGT
jgi:hypothetical protein